MIQLTRNILRQDMIILPFPVSPSPAPIAPNLRPEQLITTIVLSVPSAQPSVWLGNAGVTPTAGGGLEIISGGLVSFVIENQDEEFELQEPLLEIQKAATCKDAIATSIPFIVWDLSTLYLTSTGTFTMGVGLFRTMWNGSAQ